MTHAALTVVPPEGKGMRFGSDYDHLLASLQGPEYQDILLELQKLDPFFRRFAGWDEVIALMRQGTSEDVIKDKVLRPLLMGTSDHRCRAILLAIFWPGLVAIHSRRRAWDQDGPGELWQRVFWCFHHTISRVDVQKRPDRLVQKIYNDTVHRLHETYEREWTLCSKTVPLKSVYETDLGLDVSMLDGLASEEQLRRLQALVDQGQLTETDFRLVVGTLVYGFPLEEAARQLGLGYEAAKKRRQRALATIRSSP